VTDDDQWPQVWHRRLLTGAVAVALLVGAGLRSGILADWVRYGFAYTESHWLLILSVVAVLLLLTSVFPMRAGTAVRGLSRKHPVVVGAAAAALVLGGSAAFWVYVDTPPEGGSSPLGMSAGKPGASIQSAVLVAGLVAALVGLWFNDQRRRREDETLQNETARLQQESTRLQQETTRLDRDKDRDDEGRFIKAVELTGHDNAGVRIGALHSLAGLARLNPDRLQTVMEVLCAYLRQPFKHPAQDADPDVDPAIDDGWRLTDAEREERHREHLVRKTAQALLVGILPSAHFSPVPLDPANLSEPVPQQSVPVIHVDLTGARLASLKLEGKIAQIQLDGAWVLGSLSIQRCVLVDDVSLQGAIVSEDAFLVDTRIEGSMSAAGMRAGLLTLASTTVDVLDLDRARLHDAARGGLLISKSTVGELYLPSRLSTLRLLQSVFTEPLSLEVRLSRPPALHRSQFLGDLDMSDMTIDAGGFINLNSVQCRGDIVPPTGWVAEPDSDRGRVLRRVA